MTTTTKPQHKLIAVDDAERLTGLAAGQLLKERDVQPLTRISGGKREEMLRVPVELLLETDAEQAPPAMC
jgi:hypothetical protein